MGAAFCRAAEPDWNPTTPLASGSDKEVFLGTFQGKPVAVCVAKQEGRDRLKNEIEVLKKLGKHPHIVNMLYSNTAGGGAYLALERIEPIGFDVDRLLKQYVFAKQSVPSSLTRALIQQLCSALDFMHGKQVIHRDLKSENVLVTMSYEAKLIDMGIACNVGVKEQRWVWTSKSYFAPEFCQGQRPQGPEVDTWGLGVILHQIYQHRWDLVDASKEMVVPRPNRPSKVEPMEESLKEAMFGLLAFDPAKRWTTKITQEKIPPDGGATGGEGRDTWQAPATSKAETRKLLCQYKDSASPLTAYAAKVQSENTHLVGKRVQDLGFRSNHGGILLLVDVPSDAAVDRKRSLKKSPNRDTLIEDGAWLYFGLPPKDNTEDAVARLKQALFPGMNSETVGRSVNPKAGLMAFTLEFDCFQFPEHIGQRAVIGRVAEPGATSLALRANFGLNLAGIVRMKNKEPEWFPGPSATVEPGDLGLVVRCPCRDGTTEPTIADEHIQPLLDKEVFTKIMKDAEEASKSQV